MSDKSPGWYPDPADGFDSTGLRYWDGAQWTDDVCDCPPQEAPVALTASSVAAPVAAPVATPVMSAAHQAALVTAAHQTAQSHPYQRLSGFVLAILAAAVITIPFSIMNTFFEIPREFHPLQAFSEMGASAAVFFYALGMLFSVVQTIAEIVFVIALLLRNRHVISLFALTMAAGLIQAICILTSLLLASGGGFSQGDALMATYVAVILGLVIAGALLLVYFFKSVRFRTYMKSDVYITQGIWKFVKPPKPAVPDPTS